jgi:hypothetical protein
MEVIMRKFSFLVVAAMFLAGCASGVARSPKGGIDTSDKPKISANDQISNVSVSMTDGAKEKALKNPKFDKDELLKHVIRTITAKSMLNETGDKQLPALEVQVKDMRIRSKFSAVMWGFMAGADSIKADIVLTDAEGRELDRFEVSTSYALGGFAGGQDSTRMTWLYEKFAEETVSELMR